MKKSFISFFVVLFIFISCKKEVNPSEEIMLSEDKVVLTQAQRFCYQGIVKNDTINLKFEIDSNQVVKGDLAYFYFEKDKNEGTINGRMIGDTLKATYNFISEGIESAREVVFLKKGKIMIEAYGDTEQIEQKIVFKDSKKLFFDSVTVLSELNCAEAK